MVDEIDLETLFKIKQMDERPLKIIEDQLTEEFKKFKFENYVTEEPISSESDPQFSLNLQRFIESRLVMGVSPTSNLISTNQSDTAKSNKGK